jgi:hypothetical protein
MVIEMRLEDYVCQKLHVLRVFMGCFIPATEVSGGAEVTFSTS